MRLPAPSWLLLLAAVATGAGGCSQLPTAPSTNPSHTPGESGLVCRIDDPPAGAGGPAGSTSTIDLRANQAGTLTAGRFRLVIRKNSLRTAARITMIQPDPTVMEVRFVVTPESANAFRVPVKLVADCSNDPASEILQETLYWLAGDWQPAAGVTTTASSGTLSAKTQRLVNCKVDRLPDVAGGGGDEPIR